MSVTQESEVIPLKLERSRKAGTGRPAARTTSRASTSIVMGALRSVAGSNSVTSWRVPAARPAAASRRGRLSASDGASGISRDSVRRPLGVAMVRSSRRPSTRPLTSTAPVPGSSVNANERTENSRSTCTSVRKRAAEVAPSRAICSWPSSRSSNPSAVGTVSPTMNPILSPR